MAKRICLIVSAIMLCISIIVLVYVKFFYIKQPVLKAQISFDELNYDELAFEHKGFDGDFLYRELAGSVACSAIEQYYNGKLPCTYLLDDSYDTQLVDDYQGYKMAFKSNGKKGVDLLIIYNTEEQIVYIYEI